MTKNNNKYSDRLKVYVRPQSVTDCFLVTMDPNNPLKICLYPSINDSKEVGKNPMDNKPDELDDLILHNYLILKRNVMRD